MNKLSKFLILAFVFIIMMSCATVVEFQLEHPPLVDMRNIHTITVIPLEWNVSGEYAHLAGDATQALTAGIRKVKAYRYVDPSIVKNIDASRYWEYIDVYVTGSIVNVASHDRTEIREEKRDDKTEIKEYVVRTVTVDIEYTYIRAIDAEALGVFHKTEKESVTFDNTARSSNWFVNLLLGVFFPRGTPPEKIARSAIKRLSNGMEREIVPWTALEKRRIEENARKDPAFKEAQKLVGRKKYFEALVLYKRIYEETGDVAAGYNTALLLEANGQFMDALALLEELNDRIVETGVNSPPYIRNEIENLKKIINELDILEDYKKRRAKGDASFAQIRGAMAVAAGNLNRSDAESVDLRRCKKIGEQVNVPRNKGSGLFLTLSVRS
ncbi:MAG: hypothetical protein LBF60_02980 [Treponema sp.]|jgi:hypothetical protein|nr:hypothetical protein [Treponema sp.]